MVLHEFSKLWQILSSKHVAIPLDFNHLGLLIVFKTGVLVAPSAQPEVVDLDFAIRMIINYLRVSFSVDTYRFF